jgi:hypothetical protein
MMAWIVERNRQGQGQGQGQGQRRGRRRRAPENKKIKGGGGIKGGAAVRERVVWYQRSHLGALVVALWHGSDAQEREGVERSHELDDLSLARRDLGSVLAADFQGEPRLLPRRRVRPVVVKAPLGANGDAELFADVGLSLTAGQHKPVLTVVDLHAAHYNSRSISRGNSRVAGNGGGSSSCYCCRKCQELYND